MKYAKFSDTLLSDFKLDDNGETLVLTDKRGYTRAVKLLPYEERTKGEWVLKEEDCDDGGNNRYECSKCHHSDIHSGSVEVPYCWYCGAKMKGDGNA